MRVLLPSRQHQSNRPLSSENDAPYLLKTNLPKPKLAP